MELIYYSYIKLLSYYQIVRLACFLSLLAYQVYPTLLDPITALLLYQLFTYWTYGYLYSVINMSHLWDL